jgi:hypothetical protein
MKVRAWLLALYAALALSTAAYPQARPPSQKTGPITIYGDGSTGNVSAMSVTAAANSPVGSLAQWLYSPNFAGGVMTTGVAAVDKTYAAIANPDAVMVRSGNSIVFCPSLSCIKGPPNGTIDPAYFGTQRASALFSTTTKQDGAAEEQTVAITTTIATGYTKPYAALTAYALGDNTSVGNAVYRATKAGTTGANSAPPGTRPTALPANFTDGTVTWTWINDQAINSKVGLYGETRMLPGAGQSWSQAFNLEMDPGVIPTFATASELDLTNNSGTDCVAGTANCLGLYIRMQGKNSSTAGINVEGNPTTAGGPSSIFGVRLSGPLATSSALSVSTTKGGSGLGLGTFGPADFSVAAIDDASTAPVGLNVTGTKSLADLRAASTAGRGLQIQGAKSVAAIDDSSTSPAGINISGAKSLASIRIGGTNFNGIDLAAGSYTGSQLVGIGFSVNPTGVLAAAGYMSGGNTGQNCSGPPSANFTVTNGIVTRC